MSEVIHETDAFPFPPAPRFSSLTEVCRYLNDCGFDITWQSFHRAFLSYEKNMRPAIRQQMIAHGIQTKIGDSLRDHSMLIVKDMLQNSLRHTLVEAIQKRSFANRIHIVHRLNRYAWKVTPPPGLTRQKMMLNHLDAVLEAIIESIDAYNGGQTNQGYLNNLYRSSIKSSMTSVHLTRRPEKWFVVLKNQQDINLDVLTPRFARSYVTLFQTFGGLLEDDEADLHRLSKCIDAKKDLDAVIHRLAAQPNTSMADARAITSAKTEEAVELRSKATRGTLDLARVLKRRDALQDKIAILVKEGKTILAAKEIREEMRKTLKAFGCSTRTEKRIYRGCSALIEDLDHGRIFPEEFEERAYNLVYGELEQIAKRSVVDPIAHAAVIDYKVADFISEIFGISRKTFELRRFDFAQHVARYMDSEPQSSDDLEYSIED